MLCSICNFDKSEFDKVSGTTVHNTKTISVEDIQLYIFLKNDHETILEVYRESIARFFSNLTTTIESLTIGNDVLGDTMEVLVNLNRKLINLNYNYLENTNLMQYIIHIKSLKTLDIKITFSIQMNTPVFRYATISKLNFTTFSQHVTFDWLLATFPSLEALDIR